MQPRWPYLAPAMKIGVFGGTFDPVHSGHELVARRAMRACGLDQLWWIPTHGNPLKSRQPTAFATRVNAIKTTITDPKQKIIDVETLTGSRFTVDQLAQMRARYPRVQFVLIMGADLIDEFPKWRGWRDIIDLAPICIVSRPEEQLRAGLSKFAEIYRHSRLSPNAARLLAQLDAPAWVLLTGEMSRASSTALRMANSS